jgi:hypothetical protein
MALARIVLVNGRAHVLVNLFCVIAVRCQLQSNTGRSRSTTRAEDQHEREELLRIAAQWDRLADHKGRKEAERETKGDWALRAVVVVLVASVAAAVLGTSALYGHLGKQQQ